MVDLFSYGGVEPTAAKCNGAMEDARCTCWPIFYIVLLALTDRLNPPKEGQLGNETEIKVEIDDSA